MVEPQSGEESQADHHNHNHYQSWGGGTGRISHYQSLFSRVRIQLYPDPDERKQEKRAKSSLGMTEGFLPNSEVDNINKKNFQHWKFPMRCL